MIFYQRGKNLTTKGTKYHEGRTRRTIKKQSADCAALTRYTNYTDVKRREFNHEGHDVPQRKNKKIKTKFNPVPPYHVDKGERS